MVRYRIQFKGGNWIYLSPSQLDTLIANASQSTIPYMNIDKEYPVIAMGEIQYAHREELQEGQSTIITPKTATELREEKQRKEQEEAPVTLDEQLAKVA